MVEILLRYIRAFSKVNLGTRRQCFRLHTQVVLLHVKLPVQRAKRELLVAIVGAITIAGRDDESLDPGLPQEDDA